MPSLTKHRTDESVYEAAIVRINLLYDRFDFVMISCSFGKDSSFALNLALEVARLRNRLPLDVLFVDEEAITPETVEYAERMLKRKDIRLKWACLPIKHRNACSRTQPYWYPWLEEDRHKWTREMPAWAITIKDVPQFKVGKHSLPDITPMLYESGLGTVADIRGIRTDESIRRLQSVTKREVDNWITQTPVNGYVYRASPIYDASVQDVWAALRQFDDYNRSYDLLALAGVPPSLQRCTPPFGEEPLQKLWTYATCWPELWEKMLVRVDGVATAWRYALTDLYGTSPKEPPQGMSYRDWCYSLIDLYEPEDKATIAANVTQMIKLHRSKTRRPIPETEADPVSGLSWLWIAKCINQGDLKGRKAGQLLKHAMARCKKLGITHEEALKLDATIDR